MENHIFLMGKSTISMAIFNSYVTNYQRVQIKNTHIMQDITSRWMGLIAPFSLGKQSKTLQWNRYGTTICTVALLT